MRSLLNALRGRPNDSTSPGRGAPEAIAALRIELDEVHAALGELRARAAEAEQRMEQRLAVERGRVAERAALAGMPKARLLSTSIALKGRPSERMRVRRLTAGEPVERPFGRSSGVTRCATDSADVRELWERLLTFEAEYGDVLRGLPSTVLDVPGATVSAEGSVLRIALGTVSPQAAPIVAVPRFTYDFASRKRSNFGHWLLDCVPQVAALATIAPDARVLLPPQPKEFQLATLALLGLDRRQLVAWDGAPVECARLLALENDGRTGGGRPLSALMEVRRRLAEHGLGPSEQRHRLVYVSRRDAAANRQWVSNEADVEALFQSRGFDVVVMGTCPLDEQVRLFREARVVAGVSGAGLSDIVFAAAGTHVVVLLPDPLIRWYAEEDASRSLWTGGRRDGSRQLAALGDSPRFYAHLAAAFEQVCHSFVAGERMPIDRLTGFLDEVLGEVNRA